MNKIKIYLSSYKEIENHGKGKKISITTSKPEGSGFEFKPLIPIPALIKKYEKEKFLDQKMAVLNFNKSYKNQLDKLKNDIYDTCKESNKHIFEVLPLENEDTLLSWERSGFSSYRHHVAEFLSDLGYEVELK